jgi:pimeloyl-ACP methyl ester carboxylesterase
MHDDEFSTAQAAVLEHHGIMAAHRWVDAPVVDGQAHVLVTGDGPPVVLLNGVGVPAAMLAPLMARVDGVTQHAVDLPAFGLTDTTPDFTRDLRGNAVRFLVEVLDGLGLERPVIVGSSLGSLWASWLAIARPERVSALAHIGCPAVVLDTAAPLPMRLLSVRALGRLLLRVQPPSRHQVEQLGEMVHEHPLPPEIVDLVLATERLQHFPGTFLGTLHRLLRLRGNRPGLALTADELARIEVPTLLVFAADDPMGGASVGERVAEAVVDAELHVVAGGHAPWVHHAEQIAPLLATFLDRVQGPGPRARCC